MRKLIWHMHVSLDGFVAGPKGEMDWIHVDEEIFADGHRFIQAADAAIYGRGTYALMEGYWPTAAQQPNATQHDREHAAWATAAQKLVFSRTLQKTNWRNVRIVRDDVAGEIARLKQAPGKDIVMFGSPGLAATLLPLGVVDEYRFNLNPVMIGAGIPLFRGDYAARPTKLAGSTVYTSGVIALHYLRAS